MVSLRIEPTNLTQIRDTYRSALVFTLCVAAFMSTLDLFIVNVGLQSIGSDLGDGSIANLSWILNMYAIVFAALLVPAGRLADHYGNKRVFLLGLAVFVVGSLGCALSGDLVLIIALRALQATGAAALVPTSLGLILTAVPEQRRSLAVRLWTVSGSLGAAAGPALGGLLVHLSWRWIFLVNVPLGLVALAAAAVLAPDVRHRTAQQLPDFAGGLLLIAAIGAFILGLVQGPHWGWLSGQMAGVFILSAFAGAAFVWRSASHRAPVIDLALFASPTFSWANATLVVFHIGFGMALLGAVLMLEDARGWSSLETGLGIAPGPLLVAVVALGLRRYLVRFPDGLVAAGGSLVFALGAVVIASTNGYVTGFLPGWMLIGAGVGFTIPTLMASATSELAPDQTATGSAVAQMSRQIGLALGVAVLVAIVGTRAGGPEHFIALWHWTALAAFVSAAVALGMGLRRSRVCVPRAA